jgi:hypothetical protein
VLVIVRLDGPSLAAQSKAFLNKLSKIVAFAQWPLRLLLHREKGSCTRGSQAQSASCVIRRSDSLSPIRGAVSDHRSATMLSTEALRVAEAAEKELTPAGIYTYKARVCK